MITYLEKGRQGFVRFAQARLPVEVLAAAKDTAGVTCPFEPLPSAGVIVDLEFKDTRYIACFHMQVVVAPNEKEDGIILQRAASASYAQRRRTWRVPLSDNISFRKQGDSSPAEGVVINLSCDGLLMATRTSLRVNDVLDIFVTLPGLPKFKMVGKVVRSEIASSGRVGVLFVELSREARRSLTYFMWEQLRKMYPKEISALWPGSRRRIR
jgi:hypothetical protein